MSNYFNIPQPWECPRCHKINGPHVDQCSCQPAPMSNRCGSQLWVLQPDGTWKEYQPEEMTTSTALSHDNCYLGADGKLHPIGGVGQ